MPTPPFAAEIRKTGFVLENEVAQVLRGSGWTVISNKFYVDDSEEAVREIDLVAYRVTKVQHFDVYTVLIVSCKKSDANAWALLAREINLKDPIDPDSVHVCNCGDCQMLTGSGFRVSAHAPKSTFRLLSGQPKVYVKIADSGARRRHSFCPNCGTPVSSTADTDDPPTYSLRVGCLKQRAQLLPKKRNWCRSALAWAQDISTLPAVDTQ